MKKDNKGFSLIELIIVVALMAVLIGIAIPQYTKYVERTKRVKDVHSADEIAHQVEILAAYYNGFGFDVYEDPLGGGVNVLGWHRDDMLEAYGMTEQEFIEHFATPNADGSYNFGAYVFSQLGEIPVSATNPDYYWNLTYDPLTGKVNYIYLLEISPSGQLVKQMQVYPDYADFLNGN